MPAKTQRTDSATRALRAHRSSRKADAIRQKESRNDSWMNVRSKFGARHADPVLISRYIRNAGRMDRVEAESLYENDWLTARGVNLWGRDSTRQWVNFKHLTDPAKAEKLRDAVNEMKIRSFVEEGIRWGRLYGGNLLVVGAYDGGNLEEPLEIENVQTIDWLANVDRYLAFPSTWNRDEEGGEYGQTEIYRVQRLTSAGSAGYYVHKSRCLRFEGNPLPIVSRARNWMWGASVLEQVYDSLRNWGMANQAAAAIIPSFITTAMKIGNLRELIASGDWPTIQARLNEFAAQLAITNVAFYGEDEEITKIGQPIAGLPDLMMRFMEITSAAWNIPKSVLFQAEAGALGGNAAAVDVRNWYATVKAYQENELRPLLQQIFDMVAVTLGLEPGEVSFDFNPLWQLTELEQAQVYQTNTAADLAVINAGMVDSPARLGVHRFAGKSYNMNPPAVDVKRMQEYLKQLDKQPIGEEPDPEGGDVPPHESEPSHADPDEEEDNGD